MQTGTSVPSRCGCLLISTYLSIYLPIYPSIHIYLPIYPSIHLATYLPTQGETGTAFYVVLDGEVRVMQVPTYVVVG